MGNMASQATVEELDRLAIEFSVFRRKPFLILYYHEFEGEMREDDVEHICQEIKRRGFHRERKLENLDVLLHTIGGDPHAGYRIAQLLRGVASEVTFLVPEYAFSAGTLSCMCGNEIRLGECAVLSPFDISFTSRRETSDHIELMSIDYFRNFATDCREQVERMLANLRSHSLSSVESDLLVEMTRQLGALNIGKFYRARTLTGYYAEMLLLEYMFEQMPNKDDLSNKIIHAFLFEYPTHDFHMDFHICRKLGLPVQEMAVEESDKSKKLVSILKQLTVSEIICRTIRDAYKAPFIRLYVGGQ
jgi:hypothetical protein